MRIFIALLLTIILSSCSVALAKPRCPPKCPSPTPTATALPTPTATPAPSPTPPITTGIYIAPNGVDSNPGTKENPKRTILAASALLTPGQTLWVRGGTYTGQGGYNWKSSGTVTQPVTIKAYPGEFPIFDGAGNSHGIIVSGYNYVVIDGLEFRGYGKGPSGDGAILTLNARGITIQNNYLHDNGLDQLDHHIYVNSGCADIVIRNNLMERVTGWAVHGYHTPGPIGLLVEGNTIRGAYGGVVVQAGSNVRILNNIFDAPTISYRRIDIQSGVDMGSLVISGNQPNDLYNQ